MRVSTAKPDPSAFLLVGQLGSAAISFITAPVIARAIGVEGRGVTASVIAFCLVLPVVLGAGVPVEMRRLAAHGVDRRALRSARTLAVCTFIPSLVVGIAAYFYAAGAAGVAIALAVAATPVAVWWAIDLSVLVAERKFRYVMLMQISNPLVLLVSVIGMSFIGAASVSGVIIASVAGNVTTMLVGILAVGRRSQRGAPVGVRRLLRSGLGYAGAATADMLSNRVALILSIPLLGAFQAGLLSVGVTLAALLLVVGQTIAATYFTHAAREKGTDVVRLATREVVSVTLLVALIGATIVPFAVPLLFGDDFRPSIGPSLLCIAAGVPMCLAFAMNAFLTAKGRAGSATISQTSGLTVQLAALLLLSPFGAYGAATAIFLGYSTSSAIAMIRLRVSALALVPSPTSAVNGVRAMLRRNTSAAEGETQ